MRPDNLCITRIEISSEVKRSALFLHTLDFIFHKQCRNKCAHSCCHVKRETTKSLTQTGRCRRPQLAGKSLYCPNQVLETAGVISTVRAQICLVRPHQATTVTNLEDLVMNLLTLLHRAESSYWDSRAASEGKF